MDTVALENLDSLLTETQTQISNQAYSLREVVTQCAAAAPLARQPGQPQS